MAMLNEILGPAARFQQLLTRKFGILGGAPSPQLTPEITPEFAIRGEVEDRILSQEILCTGLIQEGANPGQKSQIALYNPVGSNLLLICEHLEATAPAGATQIYALVRVGTTQPFPDLPGAGGITRRDTRARLNGNFPVQAAGIICASNAVAAMTPANLFIRSLAAAAVAEFDIPVVLSPGAFLCVVNNTANLELWTAFHWREVPMAPGETGPF